MNTTGIAILLTITALVCYQGNCSDKGVNVAFRQNASQSDIWEGDEIKSGAANAVDGNTDTEWKNGSCAHTETTNSPTWKVTFPRPVQVYRYVIYNRKGFLQRLKGFQLESLNENNTGIFTHIDNKSEGQEKYTIENESQEKVKAVKISVNNGESLQFCEMEIYGNLRSNVLWACPNDYSSYFIRLLRLFLEADNIPDQRICFIGARSILKYCGLGYYGLGCKKKCSEHCEGCDTVDGNCTKCHPGYRGHNCSQECPPSKFGLNCSKTCSHGCINSSLCDHINGTCEGGCVAGFRGDLCNEKCPPRKFGLNCNETCSDGCINSSLCDHINGTCEGGCVAGFKGHLCNEKCPPRKFGLNCNETCSDGCINSSLCDHINGTCEGGCVAGFKGHLCNERTYTGLTPTVVIGVLVTAVLLALLLCSAVLYRRRRRAKRHSQKHSVVYQTKGQRGTSEHEGDNKSGEVTEDETDEQLYFNTTPGTHKTSIAVDDLDIFMFSHDRQFFEDQFKKIPGNIEAAMTVGLSEENRHKNRYKNICAYDHSRVHLEVNSAKKQGDYINASFVAGYNNEEKFIATQGPTKYMLEDFLRMLWEQRVDKVVMLTNLTEEGKKKCEQYWPDDGEVEFGEFKVTLSATQIFADYTIRKLQLKRAGEMMDHRFTQFHFTSWPDKDVPKTPWGLVDFEQQVASVSVSQPTVVHCSAGVGRTGTFIALRNVMREAEETGYMDFYATLWKLRQDRIFMIQTLDQYIFLHKAAQVAMVCMGTTVTSRNIKERLLFLHAKSSTGESNMMREFEEICTLCAKEEELIEWDKTEDKANSLYFSSCTVINKFKNRFNDVLPNMSYKPHLACEGKGMGNYINAVLVPSFTRCYQNILTQLPLPSTVTDFWRLVTQYKATLIVAFELEYKDTDETIGHYLPNSETQTLSSELFDISTSPVEDGMLCQEQSLEITKYKKKSSKILVSSYTEVFRVNHIQVITTDLDPKTLLALVSHIRSRNPPGEGRTIFMCRNGARYAGLACVLSLLLDRMDKDRCLTVPLVVGAIKSIRHQVIPNLEQYGLLYEALERYSEASNVYGNF